MNPKRPLGVAVIVIFLVLNGAAMVLQLMVDTPYGTRIQTLTGIHQWTPGLFIVLIGIGLIAAGGLWLGYRWAWALAMIVVGVSLVVSLYLYWLGDPPYLRMAIDVVVAFYLNQGAVREYFERQGRVIGREGPGLS